MTAAGDNLKSALLHFAWSPPSGRVTATYRAEVLAYQAEVDRYVCRLAEWLKRDGAGDDIGDETLRGLVSKHVRVPSQALDGMTLRLKMATLAGTLRRPYFFDAE